MRQTQTKASDSRILDETGAWLRSVYGGRPWLVTAEFSPAVIEKVKQLRTWGCPRCFGIAAREGTGATPLPDDVELHVLNLPPMPLMEALESTDAALQTLPDSLLASIDTFDPDRQMRVLGTTLSAGQSVAGRRLWGARPEAWRAIEDKVFIDALWDSAGIRHAPSAIVEMDLKALCDTAASLDLGAGTVWAGDATQGFHGGATYTCRVTDAASARRAFERLRTRSLRARVMPFLDGIPCSMHGIVFPGHVLVLRPAEMIVLQGGATGFVYMRGSTAWDPPPRRRDEMRATVRQTGEYLRTAFGYRGAFTVDGVMTRNGFQPTELNPRVGAALGLMAQFPFTFLSDALVEGFDPPFSAAALEEALIRIADAERTASLAASFARPPPPACKKELSFNGQTWMETRADMTGDAWLTLGAGATGTYAKLDFHRDRIAVGKSLAPAAAALVDWLDANLNAGLGPLTPAREAEAPQA